jgi:hypothetical protein
MAQQIALAVIFAIIFSPLAIAANGGGAGFAIISAIALTAFIRYSSPYRKRGADAPS